MVNSAPELIGSYPRAGSAHPRTDVVVVYSTRLVMEVAPGFELRSWIKGFLPNVTVVKPQSSAWPSMRTACAVR